MSRELKFRVWCKDYNEWEKDQCFLSSDGLVYQMTMAGLKCIKSEQHIVQWFTGSIDRKGKAIYEGDIVRLEFDASFIQLGNGEEIMGMGTSRCLMKRTFRDIVVKREGSGFNNFSTVNEIGSWGNYSQEVIGNIFENPDLLKK